MHRPASFAAGHQQLGRCRATSARFRPKLGVSRQTLAEIGPASAQIAPMAVELGRLQPEFVQVVGSMSTDFGLISTEFDLAWPDVGQSSDRPKLGPNRPNSTQGWSPWFDFGPLSGKAGLASRQIVLRLLDLNLESCAVGQTPAGGQRAPQLAHTRPARGDGRAPLEFRFKQML